MYGQLTLEIRRGLLTIRKLPSYYLSPELTGSPLDFLYIVAFTNKKGGSRYFLKY
jgi:hypothetical protein